MFHWLDELTFHILWTRVVDGWLVLLRCYCCQGNLLVCDIIFSRCTLFLLWNRFTGLCVRALSSLVLWCWDLGLFFPVFLFARETFVFVDDSPFSNLCMSLIGYGYFFFFFFREGFVLIDQMTLSWMLSSERELLGIRGDVLFYLISVGWHRSFSLLALTDRRRKGTESGSLQSIYDLSLSNCRQSNFRKMVQHSFPHVIFLFSFRQTRLNKSGQHKLHDYTTCWVS